MNVDEITQDMTIEAMLENFPDAGTFFLRWGIRCFTCAGPLWGTIEDVLKDENVVDIPATIEDLKNHIRIKSAQ